MDSFPLRLAIAKVEQWLGCVWKPPFESTYWSVYFLLLTLYSVNVGLQAHLDFCVLYINLRVWLWSGQDCQLCALPLVVITVNLP